jgi:hypothetical protein
MQQGTGPKSLRLDQQTAPGQSWKTPWGAGSVATLRAASRSSSSLRRALTSTGLALPKGFALGPFGSVGCTCGAEADSRVRSRHLRQTMLSWQPHRGAPIARRNHALAPRGRRCSPNFGGAVLPGCDSCAAPSGSAAPRGPRGRRRRPWGKSGRRRPASGRRPPARHRTGRRQTLQMRVGAHGQRAMSADRQWVHVVMGRGCV